jgi:cbb3-type cytochrome oxidase maturation protein
MNIVFVLVPVSLVLVGIGLWGFFWAVRSGQFDELDAASWEILVDEPPAQGPATKSVPTL